MHNVKSFLASLSHHAGVYQMLGEKGEILYVGKAKDLKKRVSSYFSKRQKDPKTTSLVEQIKDIEITVTSTENEAVLLECNLIKQYRPRYNVLLRDDKSYPYIIITDKDAYPRIDIYRGPRKKNALYFGPFPSSLAVRETINLLQKLFRIRSCTDSFFAARTRPCLLFQINRCTAPCVGLIEPDQYRQSIRLATLFLEGKSNELIDELQNKMESAAIALNYELAAELRDQITRLRQIQDRQYVNVSEGNADVIGVDVNAGMACIQLLSVRNGLVLASTSYYPSVPAFSTMEEVVSAFVTQHYLSHSSHIEGIPNEILLGIELLDKSMLENVLSTLASHKVHVRIPSRLEKKKWLVMATASAKQSLALRRFSHSNIQDRILALQSEFKLSSPPRRLECFDISHNMGEATVGSCVVFDQGGPVKSDYRRFNITGITPGDDIAAMRQVVFRRFKQIQKNNAPTPDIIFIDGGKAQIAAAHAALEECGCQEIFLVGVSKGEGRKPGLETLHRRGMPPLRLPDDSLALHFIQQMRDEAHRFAITGHRKQRDKKRRRSTLEDIAGIGGKRRRELLRYFGGIQGIARASLDELMKVPGINRPLAERIFATLHDATI